MTNPQSARTMSRAMLAVAVLAAGLAGCAQRGDYELASTSPQAYGSSVPPGSERADSPWPNETSPDPYHYLCTGSCLRSAGGD